MLPAPLLPSVVMSYRLQPIDIASSQEWCGTCTATRAMTNAEHIKAFRLFDRALAEFTRAPFQFVPWESEHFEQCEECQGVSAVFARQFTRRTTVSGNNGQLNSVNGYYRTVCCGLELYVMAGKPF